MDGCWWAHEGVIANSSTQEEPVALQFRESSRMMWRWERKLASSSRLVGRSEVRMRYAIVIEKAGANYSAYVPDLPGCISTGETLAEVEANIREAISFHIEGMREDGTEVPPPSSQVEYVEVAP
jgi:predicted RNase H-like HicB family nuclease